jgi:cation diffusion facilitator CzcD-associated flavoprotein CzcO
MASKARRIVIIGAGPGGLCMGIRLKEAGHDDFVIVDKAEGVGGTWWHNRYPGAACDVPSHLYSFSFEIKKDWTRPYATQPEIQRYFEHVVDRYALEPHLRLGVEVRGAYWDEECLLWRVVTTDGQELTADVVVSALGMFNDLNIPDIPGLDDFAGTTFHTARWPRDHDLSGERVAVIGSAASAVQLVPEVAKQAAQLHVFQRTANWVLPKDDTPFEPEALERYCNDPIAVRQMRWKIWRDLENFTTFSNPDLMRRARNAGLRNLELVEGPEVRAKLTPDHPYGCKRPLISNDFYPAFNRPNVELVTDRIERVTPRGIVTADGTEREVDAIVLATGFATTRYLSAIEVTGRGGQSIEEAWADGAQAYLGIVTAGFPNLFMLYGPNTNQGSIIFMLEQQTAYVMRHLRRMDDEGLAWVDVRRDAMDRYNDQLQADMKKIEVWWADCGNYYQAPSGRVVTQFPHTMDEYRRRTARIEEADFDALPTGA